MDDRNKSGHDDHLPCVLRGRNASQLDPAALGSKSPCALSLHEEGSMATAAVARDAEEATRFAKDHLKAFVERVERLEEEKKAIADDIRDVYGEAKANGFDTKALRSIGQLRKLDTDERPQRASSADTY